MNNTIIPPAHRATPAPELINAVADVLRYLDRRRSEKAEQALAVTITDDTLRPEKPPSPPKKERVR